MPDMEKVIKGLEVCIDREPGKYDCYKCPYETDGNDCEINLSKDALALLKAQEQRLLTKEDFENADEDGYIPAWCEEKNGKQYWECVTDTVLAYQHFGMECGHYRYWTSRPTDEQRKAVKWDG